MLKYQKDAEDKLVLTVWQQQLYWMLYVQKNLSILQSWLTASLCANNIMGSSVAKFEQT